jgi:hypothetical protein
MLNPLMTRAHLDLEVPSGTPLRSAVSGAVLSLVPYHPSVSLLHSQSKSTAALLRSRLRACEEKGDQRALRGNLGERYE